MSDALKNTQAGILPVPWLQDPESRTFNEVLGAEKDRLVDRARTAVKMRWPTAAGAQEVAVRVGASLDTTFDDPERLRHLGATRALPRLGGQQDDAAYDAYLDAAWDVHALGGTASGIVAALQAYGIKDVEVCEEWMPGAWPAWGGEFNSRRLVVICGPDFGSFGWAPQGWPLPLGGSTVIGIDGMVPAQLKDIARIIRRVKDAASLPLRVVFRFGNGAFFGAGGVPFPIVLDGTVVAFDLVAPLLGYELPLPLPMGPVYVLE